MQRALVRLQFIRRSGCEREERPAIVQHEPHALRHEPRAEAGVVTLDQRHDVAVTIDHREIDRLVAGGVGDACELRRLHVAVRLRHVHLPCATLGLSLVQQLRHRHAPKPRIADEAQQVRVCQLLRFDHRVHRTRRRPAELGERKALHDVQHLERSDALAVGRNLVHSPPAIGGADRLHPLGTEFGEVRSRHRAALLTTDREDRVCRRAGVVAGSPAQCDTTQRVREVRVAEDLAGPRRSRSTDQVRRLAVRMGRQQRHGVLPVAGGDLRNRHAFFCIADGGGEQFAEWLRPESQAQFIPARHHTRHRHAVNAALRHGGVAALLQECR